VVFFFAVFFFLAAFFLVFLATLSPPYVGGFTGTSGTRTESKVELHVLKKRLTSDCFTPLPAGKAQHPNSSVIRTSRRTSSEAPKSPNNKKSFEYGLVILDVA
jgi:hypothetical protein